MPIEEMARRGRDTLAFGPMRPVGLVDPRTGTRPFAVRAAAAGRRRGPALQHGRLPDEDDLSRAAPRLPHDPRARSAPSSCASAACTATPSSTRRRSCCRRCRCAHRRAPAPRRADRRRRGLRRVGGDRPARRAQRGAAAARARRWPCRRATHRARLAARLRHAARPEGVPADERQLRALPAARPSAARRARRSCAGRARARRARAAGARRARAARAGAASVA